MAFKHYLNFLSLPSVGTIEISEPIGFDGASYKIKQDDKRFGRDIIIANEDTELTFTRDYFEQIQITQILPSGETFNYASQGFDYLLDIFQNDGWEGKVEYIIEKDNVTFTTGIFSYYTSVVEFDNIKVKIIQNTNREVLKRLEDTDIDAFNNKSLDGRDITPCATTNILLKAKPIVEISEFKSSVENFWFSTGYYCMLADTVINYGVQSTLSNLDQIINYSSGYWQGRNNVADFNGNATEGEFLKIIKAQNKLSNITISLILKGYFYNPRNSSFNPGGNNITYILMKSLPSQFKQNFDNKNYERIFTYSYVDPLPGNGFNVDINIQNYQTNIDLEIGETLYGFFTILLPNEADNTIENLQFFSGSDRLIINNLIANVEINATSTSIDTVVKGIRLIDLIKHNVKSIVDIPVFAREYELGGEHYDNFAFNGLLLGQITDKPFYNQFKDLMNVTMETCSDYQINPDYIEISPYGDFYQDTELAVFDELPSFTSNSMFSKQYTLKNVEFKYSKSSSERETNSKNSIDDVHTETQKYITDTVDGSLKVEIKHIRSAFLIEQARQRAFQNQETTSLQNDDNLFLLKCITLEPETEGSFAGILLQQIGETSNNLKILNNNSEGDGLPFNWNLLGFEVGDTIFIDEGQNQGEYTVISITSTILELDKNTGVPTFIGEEFIKLRWFYTDVTYTNQTNETYSLIEGVANPNNYSNLDYSWARNIRRWYPYLATATKFKRNDVIKTSSFKINGNLETRKLSEPESLFDSADIINSDIAIGKILNPFNHTVKVYAPFNVVTQLIEDIRSQKGYVSVNLNDGRMIKGFIQNMEYTWITEELDLVLEEKFISDFMEIVLTVNEDTTTTTSITNPNYPTKTDLKSFQINNIFVTLYDSVDNTLYPPTRFTNILINGSEYTDITLFSDALTELINAQNE